MTNITRFNHGFTNLAARGLVHPGRLLADMRVS
jgi:hypothetical protein